MEKLIYSKYSNERSPRFSLRTDILEQEDIKIVRKTPVGKEGEAHVASLAKWAEALEKAFKDSPFVCNKCTLEGKSAVLEYVSGETLEERLDSLLKQGEKEEAETLLTGYLAELEKIYKGRIFENTEAFTKVFGETVFFQEMECADVTDIDMVCQNLVLTNPPVVLDYEWTFDFPVPGKFVLYRVIHYYIHSNPMREVLDEEKIYRKFGITPCMCRQFVQMESSFQKYITEGHIPMRDMFTAMSPGAMWIQEKYAQLQAENRELKNEIKKKNHLIREMKNTKIWKMYRKYRKIVERK